MKIKVKLRIKTAEGINKRQMHKNAFFIRSTPLSVCCRNALQSFFNSTRASYMFRNIRKILLAPRLQSFAYHRSLKALSTMNTDPASFWNQRYSESTGMDVYGSEPNAFLVCAFQTICSADVRFQPAAEGEGLITRKALCLGEGEGRNALFIARSSIDTQLHWQVTGVDLAEAGLSKLRRVAESEGLLQIDPLRIQTVVTDIAEYSFPTSFDLVVSIFAHLPSVIRVPVHAKVAESLAPGGYFILQAYTPKNIDRNVGGPQVEDMCMNIEKLTAEFHLDQEDCPFNVLTLEEKEEMIAEGQYHQGLASVVCAVLQRK